MKPKLHILFPSEWVAYSPTILNLVDVLQEDFQVVVTSFDNGKYPQSGLDPARFDVVRVPYAIFAALALTGLVRAYKRAMLRRAIRKYAADVLIGVDDLGLASVLDCVAQAHLLSLEVTRGGAISHVEVSRIASVAIQTRARLDYLFPQSKPDKVFMLPNSPRTSGFLPKQSWVQGESHHVVLLGNLIASHGMYLCIDAMAQEPDMTLTLKGSMNKRTRRHIETCYETLLKEGRLIIDSTYTPQGDLLHFLSRFDAGLCFYDFGRISSQDFNYQSSPSGKMYAYMAAGVPVIGSDIIGLSPVREFEAGILLQNPTPENIRTALTKVFLEREHYQAGCRRAAKAFDFETQAIAYKELLLAHYRSEI